LVNLSNGGHVFTPHFVLVIAPDVGDAAANLFSRNECNEAVGTFGYPKGVGFR
jgi:hypothetical protein